MAAVAELPYEHQQFAVRQIAEFKASNGYSPVQYLSPLSLSHFPLVMESAGEQEDLSWNDVSRLFRRRDTVPATFIDENILVEQIGLNIFEKREGSEYAKRRALALFKIVSQEGTYYGLTVVYLPSRQQRLGMAAALQAVYSTEGNAIALAHMPKEYTECAYMPEPMNGKHYTLVPVSGDAGAAFGLVGDFAATVLTKGSTHL